jgi:ribosomal protein L40E
MSDGVMVWVRTLDDSWLIIVIAVVIVITVMSGRRRQTMSRGKWGVAICRRCGTAQPPHAGFCRQCGERLGG